MEEKKLLNKVFFLIIIIIYTFFIYFLLTTDVTWTILIMSLLPFWALNVVVALLSMQGQKALRFHLNILICVPKMSKGLTGLERHEGEQLMT